MGGAWSLSHTCTCTDSRHVLSPSRYNKVTELPASLCECTQLEEISLESNSLSSLPVSGRAAAS